MVGKVVVMRITWKKEPKETGLRSVSQSPRGYDLRVDGERVGAVRANKVGWQQWNGWWWYARSDKHGIPLRNEAGAPLKTIKEAKDACKAYVLASLQAKKGKA